MTTQFLSLLAGVAITLAQPIASAEDGSSAWAVPIDKPSAYLERSHNSLDAALTGIRPGAETEPRKKVTKTGQFILWGDLFHTGDCFALAELTAQGDGSEDYGVAFAEWKDGAWRLRQLWKVPTVWRPKGWKGTEDDYLPTTPATEPFELRNLGGGNTSELIIAGEVDKYFQEYYLFHFSRKGKALTFVADSMASPEVMDKYVVLYFKSPRRAIWREWQYLKWKDDGLVSVASWHDELGYGEQDPTFSEGERTDAAGKSEIIRIGEGRGTEYNEDGYELTRNGKAFGRMWVTWKDKKNYPQDADEIEKAWLFEKITGLPRQLFPEREDAKPMRKLEDFASVTIEGNDEAAKFFQNRD